MRMLLCLLMAASTSLAIAQTERKEKILFSFEDPAELKAWSVLEPSDPPGEKSKIDFQLATAGATQGKQSLQITFSGGTWPALTTTEIPSEWTEWQAFHADVTVSRPGLIGFRVLQEKSSRGGGWDDDVSRWVKTQFLRPGQNTISADLHPNAWSALATKLENGRELGKVVRLEIFLYRPAAGETIFVDNIRLSSQRLPSAVLKKTDFKVLGTDHVVGDVQELGKKLASQWEEPAPQTVEQVERDFQATYKSLRKQHPRAVLAILRDGEKGVDPTRPDEVYAGWRDAYWSSHGPDSANVERATNKGKHASQEMFMRHRSPLMSVDLGSIPTGSTIHAAKLLLVRQKTPEKERSPSRPNMWVAEACNRPWQEYEVNAYEYARGKFWKEIGGRNYDGDDPNFLPLFLAYGPAQAGCSTWDFTEAVRYWTDGKHANQGFMLHSDSHDWFIAWYREAPEQQNRPALLVIYEPAPQ